MKFIHIYISYPTGKVDFGKPCILLAYLVWFFLSSCNRISLFSWIWLEPLMSSSTTFSHKHPMLLNFWQGKVHYKDIYSRTKRLWMFYTTGLIKNQGHIVCFYVKASLFICPSVSLSFFLSLSFSACNFNLIPLFLYFYKKYA